MAPKELTRAQLSSRLSYNQNTPTFLRRLRNKYSGNGGYDDDEDNEYGRDPEFEDYDRGSGRPPIPRRPSIPERPPDDPGSAGEDDDDEKPQVVVLKEGKHLSEREAENIRRKAKGLSPLPDPAKDASEDITAPIPKESASGSNTKSKRPPLTFSTTTKSSSAKRKLEGIGQPSDDNEEKADGNDGRESSSKKSKPPGTSKKQKKTAKTKTLLSFGDDA
ncbi:hypothetical protein AX15_003025 [Amanita polypyramis BW_CC]|nr:hypothetical protein AX15_003025 [Amanita polypyramis BW_CC]